MSTTGLTYTYRPERKPKGSLEGNKRKIAVAFPVDLFRQINDLAEKNDISFREQVCRLCRVALK